MEGDIAMSRVALREEAQTSTVVDKGYVRRGVRLAGDYIALNLRGALGSEWRKAVLVAADQWNDAAPAFRERAGNPGIIDVERADLGTGTASTMARASQPPESKITLNTRYSGRCGASIDEVSLQTKVYIALHEMGHVLGFEHQPPARQNPDAQAIRGTSTGSGYATVMASGGCPTRTTLSEDDRLSARFVYPDRRVDPDCIPSCEENCLSSSSPELIGLCQSSCPDQCR